MFKRPKVLSLRKIKGPNHWDQSHVSWRIEFFNFLVLWQKKHLAICSKVFSMQGRWERVWQQLLNHMQRKPLSRFICWIVRMMQKKNVYLLTNCKILSRLQRLFQTILTESFRHLNIKVIKVIEQYGINDNLTYT